MNEVRYDIPPPAHPRKGTSSYPFAELKVGGSFFTNSSPAAVRQAARKWRTQHGGAFTVRVVDDPSEGKGVRCWRTA